MKVWTYELWPRDANEIIMPVGAEPLHVDVQARRPSLWVLVDYQPLRATIQLQTNTPMRSSIPIAKGLKRLALTWWQGRESRWRHPVRWSFR